MKRLLFSLLILSSVTAGELSTISELDVISRKHVYIPPKLGKLKVAETHEGFSIVKDDEEIPVKFHNTNHLLRHIKEAGALKQFLSEGAIFVSQDNGGDYILTARGKIKGGGYISGQIGGWTVRGLGYVVAPIAGLVGVTTVAVTAVTTAPVTVPVIAGGTVALNAMATTGVAAAGAAGVAAGGLSTATLTTAVVASVSNSVTIGTAMAPTYIKIVEGVAKGVELALGAIPIIP